MAENDQDDRAGLRGYVQFNRYTHTHTHRQESLIPPWEDQREWHGMPRMTGPNCAVMCNLINTRTHTHTPSVASDQRFSEDQCEGHRVTKMTGPGCAVMFDLIITHTHTHTHTHLCRV